MLPGYQASTESFISVCEKSGNWTSAVDADFLCDPVTCGQAPDVAHAAISDVTPRYLGTVTYQCEQVSRLDNWKPSVLLPNI